MWAQPWIRPRRRHHRERRSRLPESKTRNLISFYELFSSLFKIFLSRQTLSIFIFVFPEIAKHDERFAHAFFECLFQMRIWRAI